MLERGEAIGLLVILAVMLVATLYVAVRRTPSFGVVFVPVELALAGWVASTDMDGPDDGGSSGRWRPPPAGPLAGWSRRRDRGAGTRRPRPGSGAGTVTRNH